MNTLRNVWGYLVVLLALLTVCALVGNLVTRAIRENALTAARLQTARFVQSVTAHLTVDDLKEPKYGPDYREFAARLQPLLALEPFLRVKVFNRLGMVVWSDEPRLVGELSDNNSLAKAFTGSLAAEYLLKPKAESGYAPRFREVVELYVPLGGMGPGTAVVGVVEVYQDLGALITEVNRAQQKAWAVLVVSFALLVALVHWILWSDAHQAKRNAKLAEEQNRAVLEAFAVAGEGTGISTGHARRVAGIVGVMADALGQSVSERRILDLAALLHEVGQPGQNKFSRPKGNGVEKDPGEKPETAFADRFFALGPGPLPEVGALVRLSRTSLSGGESRNMIPLGARLLAVADQYDTVRVANYGAGLAEGAGETVLGVLRADPGLYKPLVELLATHHGRIEILYTSDGSGPARTGDLDAATDTTPVFPRLLPDGNNSRYAFLLAAAGGAIAALIYPGMVALRGTVTEVLFMIALFAAGGGLVGNLVGRVWTEATHDAVTRLPNRRMLMSELTRHVDRVQRRKAQPLGLVMIDVDKFKAINDRHGHLRGDQVLVAVGSVLRGLLPAGAVACRIGGDEFAVILPDTDRDWGGNWVARLREQVWQETGRLLAEFGEAGVSISAGLVTYVHGEGLHQFLARADAAMYAQKRGHRETLSLPSAACRQVLSLPITRA